MNIIICQNHPLLEIHTEKGIKLIPLNKIIYIKAFKKGSLIHLQNSGPIKTNYLLKLFEGYLPLPYFFRCHNSYIVNCQTVDCFCSNQIILEGNKRIPLSRSKKQEFKANLIELQQNL
jgi:two-component system, LytTR family, response regulator